MVLLFAHGSYTDAGRFPARGTPGAQLLTQSGTLMGGPAAAQKHTEIRDFFILLNLTIHLILDSSSTLLKIGGDAEEVFIFQYLDINF